MSDRQVIAAIYAHPDDGEFLPPAHWPSGRRPGTPSMRFVQPAATLAANVAMFHGHSLPSSGRKNWGWRCRHSVASRRSCSVFPTDIWPNMQRRCAND